MFRTVSQTGVTYRHSPLSTGSAGRIHGGDRLPWIRFDRGDNFAPLASLDWQVHVYGEARAALAQACGQRGLPLHAFSWRADVVASGVARNAAYLVRPDGYVAVADSSGEGRSIVSCLDRWDVTPGTIT